MNLFRKKKSDSLFGTPRTQLIDSSSKGIARLKRNASRRKRLGIPIPKGYGTAYDDYD